MYFEYNYLLLDPGERRNICGMCQFYRSHTKFSHTNFISIIESSYHHILKDRRLRRSVMLKINLVYILHQPVINTLLYIRAVRKSYYVHFICKLYGSETSHLTKLSALDS